MTPGKVVVISAITTIAGTILFKKFGVNAPGFTR